MWSPKREMVEKAAEIAKKKHPDGFNLKQLRECADEVYGGFGVAVLNPMNTKKVLTHEDVNNMGNAMAFIDGHYPAGMSTCEIVGISGNCGLECPAYLDGDCDNADAMMEGMDEEELAEHKDIYGKTEVDDE